MSCISRVRHHFRSFGSLPYQFLLLSCLTLPAVAISCSALYGQSGTNAPKVGGGGNSSIHLLIVKSHPVVNLELETDAFVRGCLERLKEDHNITTMDGSEMNRTEAEIRSKANNGTSVLWIEVRRESPGPPPATPNVVNSTPLMSELQGREVTFDYVLFAAGTGKVNTHGQGYMNLPGRLGSSSNAPYTSSDDHAYRDGREVADKVIKALDTRPSR